jgi:hypothetical protein
MRNLLRLSYMNISKKNNNTINNRFTVEASPFKVIFDRGNDKIGMRRNDDFVIFNKNRLKAVANEEEVTHTINYKFKDMYPIFPTIDLKDEHIYCLNEIIFPRFKTHSLVNSSYLDTIIHINDDNLSNDLDTSRLIMFAFGNAYSQSKVLEYNKKLDRNNDGRLKEPIVVKAVSLSQEKLNLVVYQLNTLNLNDNNGVKNIVYYENMNNKLYLRLNCYQLPYATHRNIQRMAMRYLNYNHTVYDKFLSLISYGSN